MGFWHAQSIARVGGEVAAVCDVDDAAARSLANRFKSAHASTRLEDVLEQEKIDILHICTPLSSHFELAATALSRGTHVLIEKPMTPNCAETEQLYARAADNRVLLCPVHQFPFQRGVRRALAEFGKIGKALENGDKEVSLPTEFLAKWIPETIRMEHREVIEAWNQSCDAAGFPDKKMPAPEPPPDPMVLNETVNVGHALPLKKGQTDSEEGPF